MTSTMTVRVFTTNKTARVVRPRLDAEYARARFSGATSSLEAQDDEEWDSLFAANTSKLEKLAARIRAAKARGEIAPLDISSL